MLATIIVTHDVIMKKKRHSLKTQLLLLHILLSNLIVAGMDGRGSDQQIIFRA
jgi:hypothetical protein